MTVRDLMPALVARAGRHAWTTILLAAALVVAAIAYAAGHMAMTSDASTLIAADVPWRAAERRMDAAFPGNGDRILIVVDGRTPELADRAATLLAGRLSARPALFPAVARPDGGDFFAREGLLYLSGREVRDTTARMIEAQPFLGPLAADPSLRGVAGAIGTMAEGVRRGDAPLSRLEPALGRLADALDGQAAGRPAFFSWTALVSGGDQGGAPTRQLILVRPVLDYGALMPGAAAADAIRADAAALQLDAAHGVAVRLTGSVPLSDEEFASLADRWWLVAGAMLVSMLGTLWLATRSARLTGAILLTTLAGLVVTAALGLLMVGRLNLISVAFIPLFVGLGVDFGIQLSVRFQADRGEGLAVGDALARAAGALAAPLALAAGAVCLGFLAFLPTAYRGIAELGLIASAGMAVALAFSLTLLPALVTVLRPPAPPPHRPASWVRRLDGALVRRRRAVLAAFAIASVVSVAMLPFTCFDFDPLHLRAADGEAMATLTDLMHDPDRNPNTIDILTPNLAAADRLATRLSTLPEVGRALTLASFVPDDQPAKLAAIADAGSLLDLTLDPIAPLPPPTDAETIAALRAAAAALRAVSGGRDRAAGDARRLAARFGSLANAAPGARAATAAMLVPPLQQTLARLSASLAAQPITLAGLPPEIRADWLGVGGQARVQLLPAAGDTDGAGLRRFTRAVLKVAPEATGTAVSTQGAARTIAAAFIQAGLLALAIVSALLWLALRDVREVAFTLAPVVLSGLLTLATCVLIGQPINFANIIAFPLLFGVGVAFHIYFVMAWRAGMRDLLQSSLAHAVFFSAMATGTAFGSLWLSHHPGTASMGKVLMLSLAWTLVCALIFEPALLGPAPEADRR